jgi:hypothetical protein
MKLICCWRCHTMHIICMWIETCSKRFHGIIYSPASYYRLVVDDQVMNTLHFFFHKKLEDVKIEKGSRLFILTCLSTVWNVSMGGKPMCIWSHLFLFQLSSKEKMNKIALISNNLQTIATYDPFVFSIPTSKWHKCAKCKTIKYKLEYCWIWNVCGPHGLWVTIYNMFTTL